MKTRDKSKIIAEYEIRFRMAQTSEGKTLVQVEGTDDARLARLLSQRLLDVLKEYNPLDSIGVDGC